MQATVLFCADSQASRAEDWTVRRGKDGGEWHAGSTRGSVKMLQVQRREKCVMWSGQEGVVEEVRFDLPLKIMRLEKTFRVGQQEQC